MIEGLRVMAQNRKQFHDSDAMSSAAADSDLVELCANY
jgi:hypothetical protein